MLFVRDDMVYAVMGKEHGRHFTKLFLTQFFFILFMNLFGLIPLAMLGLGSLGATATANLAVTAGLALTTLVAIHVSGMRQHGFVHHWKNFIPHGLPWFVLPIMIPVEIVGMPTVREPDGLAMSSRNRTLGAAERAVAVSLYRAMTEVAEEVGGGQASCAAATAAAARRLLAAGFDAVEYLTVVDAESLRPLDRVNGPARVVAATRLGRTRLIDNIAVGPQKQAPETQRKT